MSKIGHEHIVGGEPCKLCGKVTKSPTASKVDVEDTKGVRQVLDNFGTEALVTYRKDGSGEPAYQKAIDEALATLQEIMLGMLPEAMTASDLLEPKAYRQGYNAALSEVEQNIRGGFNNG